MWEIHTFGNGDVIASVLRAIRLMMTPGPWEGLILVVALLAAALFLGRVLIGQVNALPYFLGFLIILFTSTRIFVDVLVIDDVNADVADQIITGIPLAVALPAYASGFVGLTLTQLAETAFAMPASFTTGQSTFNRPLFDLQKILDATIADEALEARLEGFLVSCVFQEVDVLPVNPLFLNIDTLRASPDLLLAMAPASSFYAYDGVACPVYYAANILGAVTVGNPGYDRSRRYLQTQLQLTAASPADDEAIANALVADLIPVGGQTGLQLIHNAMLVKSWRRAVSKEAQERNDPAGAVANLEKTISQDLSKQAFSSSRVIQKVVPMLRSIVEGLVYAVTPLLLVMAISPAMGAFLGLYARLFIWLQLWTVLYAFMNLVLYQEAKSRLATMTLAGGFGSMNLNSYDSYVEFVSMLNSVASDYVWLVPTVSWALVWGTASGIGALANAGGKVRDTSASHATEFAFGKGQTMQEGMGPRWESQLQLSNGSIVSGSMGEAAGSHMVFAPVAGTNGISMVDQVGNMTMRGQDGSVTSLAANGAMSVQTPYGSYSKDKDGKLASGVFRGKVYDPESGRTMEMQQEVRGDEIFSRGVYQDKLGREHKVEQVNNQASGHQVSRIDTFKSDGFEGIEETFSDGTKIFQTKRTGVGTLRTPMSGDISGEMVQEDSYIKQPGKEGGYRHVAGSAHQVSKDGGEKKYAIARPGGNGDKDDIMSSPGTAFVVSGTDSNVVDRNRMAKGLSERSVEGSGAIFGKVNGVSGVVVKDLDGHEHFLEGAKFSGEGGLENGQPKEGSIVSAEKETGTDRIHATGKMVKDSDSGQLVMEASNLTFSRKIGGEASGQEKVVPLSNGNFLVFKGGDLSYKGNPVDPKTPYDYKGIVLDPQTGIETSRTMHFDGQNLVSSSGSGGQTQQLVQADGSTMTIDGDMSSPGGAKYTRSWPVQRGLVHVGNDSGGHSIVEERAFSRKETGSIKSSANEGIQISDQNNQISEDSARGQSKLSGSFINADKGSLVGKDGHSLLPPVIDTEGQVQLGAQRVPVFVPASGKESSRVDQQGLGVGMKGEPVEQNRTIDPSSGAVVREKVEGGKSSNFYLDETKIHAADEAQSSYGHWILEAARASKNLDSQAMTEKYGAWAGSLGDIVRLERFDPDNPEHKGGLLMGLEMLDKAENVADKSLMYASRFGSIMRAAQLGKRWKQGQSVGSVAP